MAKQKPKQKKNKTKTKETERKTASLNEDLRLASTTQHVLINLEVHNLRNETWHFTPLNTPVAEGITSTHIDT